MTQNSFLYDVCYGNYKDFLVRSLTTSLYKKSFHPFIQLHTPTDPQSATCRMFYEWHHERGLLCQRLHPQDHLNLGSLALIPLDVVGRT